MAKLDEELQVPYKSHALKCPVCEDRLEVVCFVTLHDGSVYHAGTAGFRQPVLAATIVAEPTRIVIKEHRCVVPRGTDA